MAVTARLVIVTIGTATTFAPALAALWARRSWHEPAGQAAVGWFTVAVVAVVNFVAYRSSLTLDERALVTAVGTVLYVPPLLPHTLAFAGPAAKRWQWPVIGAWLVCAAALAATLGTGREFRTVALPIVAIVLCTASALALAWRVKQAPTDLRHHDWFWILTGQLLYFSVELFRKPVIEVLWGWNREAATAVHWAIVLTFPVCYFIIARGMLLRAPVTAPPPPLGSSLVPSV